MGLLKGLFACAFLLLGSSMAGPVQTDLPGVGTFAYRGPPIAALPSPVVVATNEK